MAKKNRIFSNDNTFVSKYYSRKGSQQRKKAMAGTLKYKKAGFDSDKDGPVAIRKYAILMESLPKDVADEIRDEHDEFLSSGDVIEAADYLAENYTGVQYFSKEELIDAMKTLREQRKNDKSGDFDPFEGLDVF